MPFMGYLFCLIYILLTISILVLTRAQARLETPQLGNAKTTTSGVRSVRLLVGWVINLSLFVRKRSKTQNSNLLEYEV